MFTMYYHCCISFQSVLNCMAVENVSFSLVQFHISTFSSVQVPLPTMVMVTFLSYKSNDDIFAKLNCKIAYNCMVSINLQVSLLD